jgi:hypothetical protein
MPGGLLILIMIKFYIFLLFFGLSIFINGQTTYNNIYWPNNIATAAGPAVIVKNDTIFTATYMEGVLNHIVYRTFDRSGTLLDSNMINWNSTNVFSTFVTEKLISFLGSELVVVHPTWTNNFDDYVQFVKFDKALDTISTNRWKLQKATIIAPIDLISDSMGITLVGSYTDSTLKYSLFIARFDTALNYVWHQTISDFRGGFINQYNGFFPYRVQVSNDALYIVGRCFYPNVMVEGFVVKTDLEGHKIWDKRYRYQNKNTYLTEIIFLEDSLLIAGSFVVTSTGNQDLSQMMVLTMDSSGSVLHEKVFPEQRYIYPITSMIKTRDSSFVLSSFHYHTNIFAVYGILTKFNQDMEILWRRTHLIGDFQEDENFIYRLFEWSDGGLLATGTHFKGLFNPLQKYSFLWLLSTDSIGCLDAQNCGHNIGLPNFQSEPSSYLTVYPNPTKGIINFKGTTCIRTVGASKNGHYCWPNSFSNRGAI